MKKVYNQSLGGYILVDPITRQPLTKPSAEQGGEGAFGGTGGSIFDVFSKIGSKVASEGAKKLAGETVKKVASSALDSGAKALGQKVGEKVVEKIIPTSTPKPKPSSTPTSTPKPKSSLRPEQSSKEIPGLVMKEIMKPKPKRNTAAELSVILGKGRSKNRTSGSAPNGGNKRIQRLLQ